MKKYFLKDLGKQEIKSLISRETIQFDKTLDIVRQIEQDVINKGDQCLKELTEKFDGINLDKIRIDKNEIQNSSKLVEQELKDAIKKAFVCIKKFHENQLQKEPKVETEEGVNCWREARAISDVGFYIPSGTAPLFSTVLMLGVPALIAGSRRIVVCTPPPVASEILYACKILDIDEVYQVGGAQAIFAMTYGTDEISKVDKIFGPGNRFVSCAKALASSKVAIDMIAGPSEVLVIADNDSNPSFVASDLLSQAEHGADSQSVLVCLNEDKADQIIKEAYKQLEALPRKNLAIKSLENSFAVITNDLEEAVDFSDMYAPEHLILSFDDFEDLLPQIQNAGSVFCGQYSPESAGDYASGTNHTLPTSGFAKSFSGVSVDSFIKKITFQNLTKKGLENLAPAICKMAEKEGLDAHKNAVLIRINEN